MISNLIQFWKSIISPLEIGSDFALQRSGQEHYDYYHDFTVLYTARACIKLMIENTSGPYLLPSYTCSSVIDQFTHTEYEYYTIDDHLQIDVKNILVKIRSGKFKTVYFIDYFGVVDTNMALLLEECRKYDLTIVEDFTHRPFDIDNLYGDINLCSIRKTLPVPYGGIIKGVQSHSDTVSYSMYFLYLLKMFGMGLKRWFVLKPLWRPLLVYCEESLDHNYVTTEHNDDIKAWLQSFDHQQIKQARLDNFRCLYDRLKRFSLVHIPVYAYFPLVFDSKGMRDRIRLQLIANRVYPAVHWPYNNHDLCDRILSIPIDQRYTPNDMERIASLINELI